MAEVAERLNFRRPVQVVPETGRLKQLYICNIRH
jgi:hypothetical protein